MERGLELMRTFFYVVAFALMTASLGGGQIRNNSVVDARTVLATDAAHPNSNLKMAVVAQVAPDYHINNHKPTLDYLIATELKLDSTDQITVKTTIYPKGTLRKFAFSDVSLSVYEGTIVVGAILQVAKAAPSGSYVLKGKFAYQACNDHACLPPTSVPVSVTVKVVPRAVPLKPVDSDVFQRIQFE